MSKTKHLKTVIITVLNLNFIHSMYADELVGHKWTKAEVLNVLILAACPNPIDLEKEFKSLENNFDAISQHLVEILNESDDYLAISTTLHFISNAKTHHELFINVISNKLESWGSRQEREPAFIKMDAATALGNFGGDTATTILINMLDDEDAGVRYCAAKGLENIVKGLENIVNDRVYDALSKFVSRKRDKEVAERDRYALNSARRALERMNQTRENTNKDTLNPAQEEPTPQLKDTPIPEPPTPATTNETTQAKQDIPFAQFDKTSSNKPIFLFVVIILFAILGGVAMWRKKRKS